MKIHNQIKQFILLMLLLMFIASCKKEKQTSVSEQLDMLEKQELANTSLAPISNEIMEHAVIYEANIRQYSPEGTFKAFTKDIPVLKELGVRILWLMPIYPISKTKSKGSLGSYYAVSDYTKINPEFGTLDDFKNLIKTAHENEIYVVLDWVANHTGWDHHWIKEHPDFYTKDKEGNITHTVGTDWTDVADLNYENQEMRSEMLNAMQYWVQELNVDGFRCDVAGMVPVNFWDEVSKKLEKTKPLFMLAEGWEPELLANAFDMGYAWNTHHIMNDIAKGKQNVSNWDQRMVEVDTLYQKDDILMNFITNHDENSWNGTVKERMGDASELFAVLSYMTPGMPLIYSGQEYGMNKRLRFFEKDTIPKSKGNLFTLYQKLGQLKNKRVALSGGKNKADYIRLPNSQNDKVLSFARTKSKDSVFFIANMSDKDVSFEMEKEGEYLEYFSRTTLKLQKKTPLRLKPWGYMVLVLE